jgi:lysophospholipase L1-like esterase
MQGKGVLLSTITASLMAQSPAKPLPLAPDALAVAKQHLQEWRKGLQPWLADDWGQMNRYRAANAQLKPPTANEGRVVFFGDSITDMWRLQECFPGKPYVNRGIGGQTTAQMLVRFRQDVIALQPKAVVILAGTNDIAGNTGPVTLQDIEANFATMAELAKVHGIRVVFSSILPVHNYTLHAADMFVTRPMSQIQELNRWLKDTCAANGYVYLDYYTPMLDEAGFLKRELAEDGLHPNAEGFKLMVPLAEAAIQKALHQP